MLADLPAVTTEAPAKPPVILTFHPGGFGLPEFPGWHENLEKAAAAKGLVIRNIDYALTGPFEAWLDAKRAALQARRQGHQVLVYGESAGGTLATLLVQRGYAQAGAVNAPIVNLAAGPWSAPPVWRYFSKTSTKTRRFLSPAYRRSQGPLLVVAGVNDQTVLFDSIRRWTSRDNRIRLIRFNSGHVEQYSPSDYRSALNQSLEYLDRHSVDGPAPRLAQMGLLVRRLFAGQATSDS